VQGGVANAVNELARALGLAELLVSSRDTTGPASVISGATVPGSRIPANAPAFYAVTDAHAEIRRIEAWLREQAGLPERLRGGSTENTLAALKAIIALAETLEPHRRTPGQGKCRCGACKLLRSLTALTNPILALSAIDKLTHWTALRTQPACPECGIRRVLRGEEYVCPNCGSRVRRPVCPYCRTFSLRVADRSTVVACFYSGDDGDGCKDADGNRPFARVEISKLSGIVLVWSDGLVQGGSGLCPKLHTACG
jgi:hypothetical protein